MSVSFKKDSDIKEHLIELPLFQGMSNSDIESVITSTNLRRITLAKGKVVVSEDDMCDTIYFLTSGIISSTKRANDGGYSITENIGAPEVLQPERIFGLTQRYTRTFKTFTSCSFLCIAKRDVLTLSDNYQIFRINLLNIISTRSQRLTSNPWRMRPKSTRDRIVRFIEERCSRPAGEKILSIKMERLAYEIGESRLNVSKVLNSMNKEGIIAIKRGYIHIPQLERLVSLK